MTKACYYEPELNRTYEEMAEHYGTAILPTRVRKPRDKSKVEAAVLHAERRLIAPLRDQTFFSVGEINAALRHRLERVNQRPFQKMPGCRAELFAELDRPALQPLPAHRYEFAEWSKARANIDYHVQVDWHYYSVPHALTRQELDVRLAARTVELFHKGRRVAAHPRSWQRGGFTTDPAHRPKSHRSHLEWTPSRLIAWGRTIGPECARAIDHILTTRPHPEQGYRACLGVMRLAKGYGSQRLEAACGRALALNACSYKSIQSILKTKMDHQPLPKETPRRALPRHDNIRGTAYYARAQPSVQEPGQPG